MPRETSTTTPLKKRIKNNSGNSQNLEEATETVVTGDGFRLNNEGGSKIADALNAIANKVNPQTTEDDGKTPERQVQVEITSTLAVPKGAVRYIVGKWKKRMKEIEEIEDKCNVTLTISLPKQQVWLHPNKTPAQFPEPQLSNTPQSGTKTLHRDKQNNNPQMQQKPQPHIQEKSLSQSIDNRNITKGPHKTPTIMKQLPTLWDYFR